VKMKVLHILLIISIVLYNVLGCEPLDKPFWTSPDGYWDWILGTTSTQKGPGIVLYSEPDPRLRHVFLSGESDWERNLTVFGKLMFDDIIYMNPLVDTKEPVVVRFDANTGNPYSNLSITVHDITMPGLIVTENRCGNILYSIFGDVFYSLVASDASTGEWIWQTPYEGAMEWTILKSNDCKYVTFVRDPPDNNLNYTLVRLDAKTGNTVWETTLNIVRSEGFRWDWFAYESDVANRVAVIRYIGDLFSIQYNKYDFQLFNANSGKKTFEKNFPGTPQTPVFQSPVVFSKDGSLVILSPLETIAISIGTGNEDVQAWSTGGKDGVAGSPYFSNSSKTALFSIWNYGTNKFVALNTKDGSLLWESSWAKMVIHDLYEFGSDLLAMTGQELYKIDTVKCPLP